MIYQVNATLYFDKHDEAYDFFDDCLRAYEKGVDLNPDQLNAEMRCIKLIENNHDINPTAPCDVIEFRGCQPQ